jgi:hypothetical protein
MVNFKEATTEAFEGDTAMVELILGRPWEGSIDFRVSGTADDLDHGLNCTPDGEDLLCSAQVSGSPPQIQVPITDDVSIEEVEWVELRLEPGEGYEVGALGQHVISVEDNDAVWEGLFSSTGEELGFSVEILRQGSFVSGKLLTEGGGVIPAGAKSLSEPERVFHLAFDPGSKNFSATLPAVPLPAEDTLLGAEGSMWLYLQASEATGTVDEDRVEGRMDLGSSSRLQLQFDGQTHLDCNSPGSFVLQRRPATPSSAEVPLE